MEALIIEKSEALRHISQFLSPRINGAIYCSEAEKAEHEQERVKLSARIAEIEAIVSGQQRAEEQEQKINEIDAMDLPFDFDADFGTVGVNTIVRQMLKEERASNFVAFNAEYDRLKAEYDEEVTGYTEREIQLQMQNRELQEENNHQAGLIIEFEAKEYDSRNYVLKLEEDLRNANNRNAEVEQNRKNAADQLEEAHTEIERLERLVDEQRIQFNFGERGLQRIIDVTETVQNMYTMAVQATAEKRKVMVTANLGLYREVQDADGAKEILHHSELAGMEQVDSFHIELPSIENPTGEVEEGTRQDVAESDVVLGGSETALEGHQTEGETPATTTAETNDETDTEETFEERTERRLNAIEHRLNKNEPEYVYEAEVA